MLRLSFIPALLFVALTCSPAAAIPLAFEYFDYSSASPELNGKFGGFGWSDSWVSEAGTPSINGDSNSLDSAVYPFTPVGDRAYSLTSDQGGGTIVATRPFTSGVDMGVDGNILYVSYLTQKVSATSTTSGANVEFNLSGPGLGGTAIRTGLTSPNGLLLSGAGLVNMTTAADSLPLGDTFFIVMKISSSAASPDTVQVSAFSSTDVLPATDPVAWDLERSDYEFSSVIDTARVWIGASAEGAIDEIRLGSTWDEVTVFDPSFIHGDFDGLNGLDPNDYLIWRNNLYAGTTYAQGDFNGDGSVDMRDFVGFRIAWNAQGLGAFPGSEAVPEPSSFALLLLMGVFCGAVYRRRNRRWSV